jgi:hypothetical protein
LGKSARFTFSRGWAHLANSFRYIYLDAVRHQLQFGKEELLARYELYEYLANIRIHKSAVVAEYNRLPNTTAKITPIPTQG